MSINNKNWSIGIGFAVIFILSGVLIFGLSINTEGEEKLLGSSAGIDDGVYRDFDRSGYIQINSSVYMYNLSLAEQTYDWMTGNGIEADPFVIEGISIDNINGTAALAIIDNEEYIVIKNCAFSNVFAPGGHYEFAGIFLNKAEKVLIQNCAFHSKDTIECIRSCYPMS